MTKMPMFIALDDESANEHPGYVDVNVAVAAAEEEVKDSSDIAFTIGIYQLVRVVGRSGKVETFAVKNGGTV